MLLTLSFSTGSNSLIPQMLTRKYSVRIRGIFSILHQYLTAESNFEEENTSNLIPPQSIEEFFFVISCDSDAKSYGCDIFHLCTSVICYSVSTAFAYTSAGPLSLKQNGVFYISHYIMLHRSAHCALTSQVDNLQGFFALQIFAEIQNMMTEMICELEQFQGRIIFM